MNRIKTIFDAAASADKTHKELCEIRDALQVLDECMEDDGYQNEENFEEWKAISFAMRYPIYQSTYRVICRDLMRAIDELRTNTDLMYDAAKAEKKAVKKGK